ncbi:MAG TPA: urea ABC transporter ATP-binding subunit UrtE [Polyangiaceae bacterium]|jgi:urea transport system ATP-binding protein|nr:urea ABC transporter ATP-binding subunit UrtE [Polyangiaceae bacterium]
MSVLELASVNQYYGESHILRDVTISVPEGSCTCLMGRNGVGKTTLLKSVMGLLPVRAGSIKFRGEDLRGKPAEIRARRGIGYVPQGRDVFPMLTVAENLELAAVAAGNGKVPDRVFELFPILKSMSGRRGGDLSGGQQQQLAIGRALTISPKLLVLDEPTEGIQPNVVSEIAAILTKLNREEKLTILLVEQKLPFARKVASGFVIMERGRAVATGAIDELTSELVQKHLTV